LIKSKQLFFPTFTPLKTTNTMRIHLFILFALIQYTTFGFEESKTKLKPDSILAQNVQKKEDSLQIAQKLLEQAHQQQMIDSLVKAKLEKELEGFSGNNAKRKQLEEQLENITRNDSIKRANQMLKINELRANTTGFPVCPFKDTLFFVYTKVGSFNPKERASTISSRIKRLYENNFFDPKLLVATKSDNTYDIIYNKDFIIVSITAVDALWENENLDSLTSKRLTLIKGTINNERYNSSTINLVIRIAKVGLILLGVIFLIFLINKGFKKLGQIILAKKDIILSKLNFKPLSFFSLDQQLGFILRVKNILRYFVIALFLYLSLPLIFSVFPDTKDYTNILLNWILTPAKGILNSILAFLPNLVTIIVIFFFTSYTVKGVHYLMVEIENGNIVLDGFHKDFAKPTFGIIRFIMYAFMLVVIFPYLPGSGSPAFQGVSVFLGLLLSLGSSSAIGNIVAGMVITYMRPFKIGDRVKIGEITGDVLEKTLLVTRIKTIKNEEITVPNSAVLSSHTVNFSAQASTDGLIVHTTITLGYDVPWKLVHKTLITAASRTSRLLDKPTPFVLQTSLDDFYVSYQINAYTKDAAKQALIYSELHQNIQDCCNEVGIEILSPHYKALRDGNMSTIPSDYLPKDYQIPSFNVDLKKDEK